MNRILVIAVLAPAALCACTGNKKIFHRPNPALSGPQSGAPSAAVPSAAVPQSKPQPAQKAAKAQPQAQSAPAGQEAVQPPAAQATAVAEAEVVVDTQEESGSITISMEGAELPAPSRSDELPELSAPASQSDSLPSFGDVELRADGQE